MKRARRAPLREREIDSGKRRGDSRRPCRVDESPGKPAGQSASSHEQAGDPIVLLAGVLRTPFWPFLILVAAGKTARYGALAALAAG